VSYRATVLFFLLAFVGLGHAQGVRKIDPAQVLLDQGRYSEAESAFRDLLIQYPAWVEAEDGLATALERQGRGGEALRRLLESGQTLVRSGDLESGTRFLERAVGLDPELASANAALGHAYLQAQRFGDAETNLRLAIELGETSPMARLFLAAAYWELGKYAAAKQVYGDLLGVAGPSAAAARRSLGALHVFRGEYEQAIPLLAAALGDSADSVRVPYDLARAFEGANRNAEAIELYGAVVDNAPDFIQAHYRLARLHRAAGESAGAVFHARRFTELHAEHQARTRAEGRLAAQLNQGWSLLRVDSIEQARALFESLPPGPETLRGLGQAQYRDGDRDAAIATIERLLESEPERLDLRLLLDEWRLEVADR
jgi:tetratricopeptide (TPR) repeat protein